MDNSKLINMLRTFTVSELREFKKFVASPYYNKNEELVLLYDYLKKIAPKFPLKKIQRKVVYQAIFPRNAYDEKHLKYLMSFLLKLAERFIGLKKYESEKVVQEYHILQACTDRHLFRNYSNLYSKAERELNSYPYKDSAYYYYQYLLADVDNRYFGQQNVRKFNAELQQAADYFDLYYIGKKLKYACEMLDRQKFLSADYKLEMLTEVQQYLQHTPQDNIPVISIYKTILNTLLDESNPAHFEQLKELLDLNFDSFSRIEMKEMYVHAINYCIRKIRQRDSQFVQEALDLYMKGIESKLLFEGDYLSPWTYNNIVKLGLRLRRYDWTETAIKTYHSALEVQFRENALNYSMADLLYHKKDIEGAMLHLRQVEFSDIFFALDAKVMLLKIYFDNGEEEALHSLIISFKAFLKRNRLISNEVRTTYLNFIAFLTQLLKIDSLALEEFKTSIQNSELLVDRKWLLDTASKLHKTTSK